jgi:hypothetical protein
MLVPYHKVERGCSFASSHTSTLVQAVFLTPFPVWASPTVVLDAILTLLTELLWYVYKVYYLVYHELYLLSVDCMYVSGIWIANMFIAAHRFFIVYDISRDLFLIWIASSSKQKMYIVYLMGGKYRCVADTSPTSLIVHLWIYTAHCTVPVTHWTQRNTRAMYAGYCWCNWPSLLDTMKTARSKRPLYIHF